MRINLESDNFALRGQRVNHLDWYEFDVRIADAGFIPVGGEIKRRFVDGLIGVLSRERGIALSQIENARYVAYVGGSESEYLGCMVFSGYHMLEFFKRGDDLKHVVLSDSDGTLLAHTPLAGGFTDNWLRALHRLRIGGVDG